MSSCPASAGKGGLHPPIRSRGFALCYGTVVKLKTLPVVVPAVFFESILQKYCVLFTRPAGVKFVPGWLPWNSGSDVVAFCTAIWLVPKYTS